METNGCRRLGKRGQRAAEGSSSPPITVHSEPMAVGSHEFSSGDHYFVTLTRRPTTFVRQTPLKKIHYSVGRSFCCIRSPQTAVTIDIRKQPTSVLVVRMSASWLENRIGSVGPVLSKHGDVIDCIDPTAVLLAEKMHALPERGLDTLGVDSLAESLILHLASRHGQSPWRPADISTTSLRTLLDYIEHNLCDALSLDDLADVAGASRSGFAHAFARRMGISPHRYVMTRRANAAVSLIRESGLALADIAAMIGFYDQAHMSRWISREIGISPARVAKAAFP